MNRELSTLHPTPLSSPVLTAPEFEALLVSVAQALAAPLPASYRAFLSHWRAPIGVDATVSGRQLPVDVFLSLTTPSDAYDLRRAWNVSRERLPIGALPIALDPYGSWFWLDLATGAASFFDHETERVELLAPDFASFEPLPDDDLDE